MKQSIKYVIIFVLAVTFLFSAGTGWCQAVKDGAAKEKAGKAGSVSKPVTAGAVKHRGRKELRVGDSFIYKITWKDQLVGYSKFYVDKKMTLAGESFYNIDSLCKMKIGMGQVEKLTFASQLTVKGGTLEPNFFNCVQKIGNAVLKVQCLVSANLIAQKNSSPAGSGDVIISLDAGEEPYFFMKNLWGRMDTLLEQYWILIKSGREGKVFAYDPVLQYKGYLEIEKVGPGQVVLSGKPRKGIKYYVHDFSRSRRIEIWVDSNYRILKLTEPGGLTAELSGKEVVARLKDAPGVDLWKNRVSLSNIFIPDAGKVDWMKINLKFKGRGLELDPIDVTGFSQTFQGDTTPDEGVSGQFTIKTSPPEPVEPPNFPVDTDFPEEVLRFTRPSMGIESDNKFVKNRALEASWKAENMWDAAIKINRWVNENVPRGIALPSAKMTLANEQGNSESRALLAIAMCRSVDIPARRAGGLVFSGGSFVPHHWMEIYTGKAGWVPLDPDSHDKENLGATHVRLYNQGEVWDLEAEVIDFKPKPPSRVTFINRELTWSVGEERVYVLKRAGKVIGTETARMVDVSIVNDMESYRMDMQTRLDMAGQVTTAAAGYWMTPQGLPIRYEKSMKSGDKVEKQFFNADGNYLVQQIDRNQKSETLKIPYSHGAYLTDTHFLSQWAVIAGQFKNLSIGRTFNFTVFIPETYSFEKIKAQVRKFESVEVGEKIYEAFRVETNRGLIFWIDRKSKRVVKLSFLPQKVDMELKSVDLKI